MSNDVQKFSHRESTFGSRPNTLPAVLCDSFAQYSVLCQTLPNDMCCRPFRFPMDSSINSLQWFMIIMIYEFVDNYDLWNDWFTVYQFKILWQNNAIDLTSVTVSRKSYFQFFRGGCLPPQIANSRRRKTHTTTNKYTLPKCGRNVKIHLKL